MHRLNKLVIGFFLMLIVACAPQQKTILISKEYNQNISKWLRSIDKNLVTKVCYALSKDSINYYLKLADGLVLGGGEDVNPLLYGKPEYEYLCDEPDNFRDTLEVTLITYAMQNGVPILGVCRGQQILNVANGGTLIPDIPTFYKNSPLAHRSKKDKAHRVVAPKGSWLYPKIRRKVHWVNSRHHQSVDEVANGFKVAAYAPDSVIESIEWVNSTTHPFAVAVQWHPENIKKDKLSKKLGKKFLKAVKRRSR